MSRILLLASLGLLLTLTMPRSASAQDVAWEPPSNEMPKMPTSSELNGNWLSSRAAWFNGTDGITGASPSSLKASGEARPGSPNVQIARFNSGPLPAVVWSDRNGDGRADMIEIFKSGGVIVQLIDADYNGSANVMRVYDGAGNLVRQDRL